MIADVTENLAIQVVPVNRPSDGNGYYIALVVSNYDHKRTQHLFQMAEQEWMRGIVSISVGYGSAGDPRGAIDNALVDYQNKFGKLCQADTEAA